MSKLFPVLLAMAACLPAALLPATVLADDGGDVESTVGYGLRYAMLGDVIEQAGSADYRLHTSPALVHVVEGELGLTKYALRIGVAGSVDTGRMDDVHQLAVLLGFKDLFASAQFGSFGSTLTATVNGTSRTYVANSKYMHLDLLWYSGEAHGFGSIGLRYSRLTQPQAWDKDKGGTFVDPAAESTAYSLIAATDTLRYYVVNRSKEEGWAAHFENHSALGLGSMSLSDVGLQQVQMNDTRTLDHKSQVVFYFSMALGLGAQYVTTFAGSGRAGFALGYAFQYYGTMGKSDTSIGYDPNGKIQTYAGVHGYIMHGPFVRAMGGW
jgi:hypothetical protein